MKRIRKITSVILAVIMVIGVITIAPFSVSAASCIKTQSQALDWLKAQNYATYDFDGSYGTQCVEFVKAYVNLLMTGNAWQDVWNRPTLNGNNIWQNSLWNELGWTVYYNTADFMPQPGDIFSAGVSNGNHTGIVISSDLNTAVIADANARDGEWSNGDSVWIHTINWRSASSDSAYGATHFIRPNFSSSDTTAPVISNARVENLSANSFDFKCELYDNSGVTRVWLNIYGPNGTSNGYEVTASNGPFSHTIYTSNYAGAGLYTVHIYAFDSAGNEAAYGISDIYAVNDTSPPVISNARVENICGDSFDINCDLSDNIGVTRIWLVIYGPNGEKQYGLSASNGAFSHTVYTLDHGGMGEYRIHIYAFDAADNGTQFYEINKIFAYDPIDLGSVFYAKLAHNEDERFITEEPTNDTNITMVSLCQDDYTYQNSSTQIWKFERQNDFSYKIINTKTNNCLTASGTSLQSCISNDSDSQRWYFVYGNGSSFTIVPKCAQNSAIDIPQNNSSGCTYIQINQKNNSTAQLFDVYQVYYLLDQIEYNGNTYNLYNSPSTWDFAKMICESEGGHLATFTSEAEFNAIKDMLEKHNYPASWLGATSINGDWEWITGENFTYSNWDSYQPDNYNSVEYYCGIWGNAKWNDYSIDSSDVSCFICEIEGNPTGDVNCDDVVNITDATTIQKHLVESVSLSDEQIELADTNGNGIVDIQDVTTIQKYLSGKISQLPYKK